jgi:hypothetical protein
MTGAEVQILVIQPVAARAIAGILLQSPVIRSKSAKTFPACLIGSSRPLLRRFISTARGSDHQG